MAPAQRAHQGAEGLSVAEVRRQLPAVFGIGFADSKIDLR
jgi:hypothetical protein